MIPAAMRVFTGSSNKQGEDPARAPAACPATGFVVPLLLLVHWLLLVFYWLICTQLHDGTPLGQSSLGSSVLDSLD